MTSEFPTCFAVTSRRLHDCEMHYAGVVGGRQAIHESIGPKITVARQTRLNISAAHLLRQTEQHSLGGLTPR